MGNATNTVDLQTKNNSVVLAMRDQPEQNKANRQNKSAGLKQWIKILDVNLGRLEKRVGLKVASAILGLILFGLTAVYVRPHLSPVNHGGDFASMSLNPFDLSNENPMQIRPFAPLLAYCLGLRGRLYLLLPPIFAVLLLSFVYGYFRKKDYSPAEAVGMASLLAFSTPILFVLHFAGYVDVVSYVFIVAMVLFRKRKAVWPLFFGLSLFNHEFTLFAAPWLFFVVLPRPITKKALLSTFIIFALASIPFLAYRMHLEATIPLKHSLDSYINNIGMNYDLIRDYLFLGVFVSFKLFWFFVLYGVWSLIQGGDFKNAAWIVLIVLCASAQLLLASDTSRLLGLAFPAVLAGAAACREKWGRRLFAKRLWMVIFFNFLIPSFYLGQDLIVRYRFTPASLIRDNWLVLQNIFWSVWPPMKFLVPLLG